MHPSTMDEIKAIIDNLKDKAGRVDDIDSGILKTISRHIVEPIAFIFNLCIDFSVWPDSLKKTESVPIFKSEDDNKVENY